MLFLRARRLRLAAGPRRRECVGKIVRDRSIGEERIAELRARGCGAMLLCEASIRGREFFMVFFASENRMGVWSRATEYLNWVTSMRFDFAKFGCLPQKNVASAVSIASVGAPSSMSFDKPSTVMPQSPSREKMSSRDRRASQAS